MSRYRTSRPCFLYLCPSQRLTQNLQGIIRGWGRSAASSDAFGLLRVLNCRSQKDITASVFAHLNQFPVLALFNVEDCNLGSNDVQVARDHGWDYRAGKDFRDWLAAGGSTGARWDSIIHMSFKIGGAFSKKILTAEDVQAIDASPVLHLSVGTTQSDAPVEAKGNWSLRSFNRGDRKSVDTVGFSKKRPLDRTFTSNIGMSCKKPTLRTSKHQNMDDVLAEFWG